MPAARAHTHTHVDRSDDTQVPDLGCRARERARLGVILVTGVRVSNANLTFITLPLVHSFRDQSQPCQPFWHRRAHTACVHTRVTCLPRPVTQACTGNTAPSPAALLGAENRRPGRDVEPVETQVCRPCSHWDLSLLGEDSHQQTAACRGSRDSPGPGWSLSAGGAHPPRSRLTRDRTRVPTVTSAQAQLALDSGWVTAEAKGLTTPPSVPPRASGLGAPGAVAGPSNPEGGRGPPPPPAPKTPTAQGSAAAGKALAPPARRLHCVMWRRHLRPLL